MSKLVFARTLPKHLAGRPIKGGRHRHLLVYDQRLDAYPDFRSWRALFAYQHAVRAGERLKSLDGFAGHARRLIGKVSDASRDNTTVVAVGGGTVGDFAGFTANVMKRGVGLIHIPSTWLAALDSAHGGKTALNLGSIKNQIGTFYPADAVVVVRALLARLPEPERVWALGELFKIALIDSRSLFDDVCSSKSWDEARLWRLLPKAIEAKLRVVRRDPEERTGARQVLNLGHTLGHALEAHHKIAHGHAVALGIRFAVSFSRTRRYLSVRDATTIESLLNRVPEFSPERFRRSKRRPTATRLGSLLRYDKKGAGVGSVRFVFLSGLGRVRIGRVKIQSIVGQACRDGWATA